MTKRINVGPWISIGLGMLYTSGKKIQLENITKLINVGSTFIPDYRKMSNPIASSNFVSTSNITWIKSTIFDHVQSQNLLEQD